MTPASSGGGGFFLSLLTESFAVRALLGTMAAAVLAALALRWQLVRSSRARGVAALAPVAVAAAAAAASLSDPYLPQLWAPAPAGGLAVELFGELWTVSASATLDALALGWAAVAALLLARRAAGVVAARRLLAGARPAPPDHPLAVGVGALAARMGVRRVRLLLLDGCPGGAFAAGTLRPVVAVDPALVGRLDARELEGLLAHELAHVARRDPLVALLAGVVADLAFFLPPVHVARRLLYREQEPAADVLACGHTRRPAALASAILKVWDTAGGAVPRGACAAVPHRRLLRVAPAGLPAPSAAARPGLAIRELTVRIERLVEPPPAADRRRQRLELALTTALLAVCATAAVAVPAWIRSDLDAYSLSVGYVPRPVESVEAPAFATLRALTAERATAVRGDEAERLLLDDARLRSQARRAAACRCVAAAAAAAPGEARTVGLEWDNAGGAGWRLAGGRLDGTVEARPLWAESGSGLGVFVMRDANGTERP